MKKPLLLLFTLILMLTFSLPVSAAPEIKSKCAVLIDMDTGQILYAKNAYSINYFDNMTKLLNVSTAINNGDLDEKLEVTDTGILETNRDSLAGKIGLVSGDRITLRDALYAEILSNADDAARIVAGNLGNAEGEEVIGDSGDIRNYVALMKSEAKYLSASQMTVSNVMGLNSSDQICTAMDLAQLMYYGFQDTNFRRILTTKTYDASIYTAKTIYTETKTSDGTETKTESSVAESLKGTVNLKSQHKMVNGTIPYDGVKGGFATETESSGFHGVTYARKTVDSGQDSSVQRKLAVVIMKSGDEKTMYDDTATLLDYGFNDWKNFTLETGKLDNYLPSDVDKMKIIFSEDFHCLLPKEMGKGDIAASTEINENGHRNGAVTFTLENTKLKLGTATFYENTNVKVMKPWVMTILYIGFGLILLVVCYLLYKKAIHPFLLMVKEQRNKKKKPKKKKAASRKEKRGYRTAEKEKEISQKEEAYFNPKDAPKRKPHSNRDYLHKKRK